MALIYNTDMQQRKNAGETNFVRWRLKFSGPQS